MRYTVADGLEALRAEARRRGRAPTWNEWHAGHTSPSNEWYRRTFGSWRAALAAAGLPAPGPGEYPREEGVRRRREETLAAAERVVAGASVDAEAERLGISRRTLDQRFYALGLHPLKDPRRPRVLPPAVRERWALVARRWREGAPLRVIAEEAGYASVNSLGGLMWKLRRRGWDLPLRRPAA